MPIFEQSYRAYDGLVRRRMRWLIMVRQELRVLFTSRVFIALLAIGILHLCFRIFQVIAYDILMQNPNNPLAVALRGVSYMQVNPRMFFDVVRMQTSLVLLTSVLAGAGMICDDFNNNLMEVYFSKPLSRRDYMLGKIMTLVLIGLTLTAVPGILLLVLHNVLAASMKTLVATYWLPLPIIGFSLLIVVPIALGVLASSALFGSQRFAAIGVFMVLFANMAVGTLLPELLHARQYLAVAFPLAVNSLGERLFQERRHLFEVNWIWPALFVAVVCLVSFWTIHRKVKRAEAAS